ncbi:hypothetical protein NJT12_10580 [Flavobacterium sp. AC]|uniref:Lipocalin-like domain-containing protein n=1 Tax=Flavobacterium azizsancarii TaxID=2961580 RepID=A0ABT4WC20_9FLAO|nr:hypothetical protein [Flavobacterium azizsancarii]MDA6070063.1 hypothetical protein [Flavobacterium azizsancarii]
MGTLKYFSYLSFILLFISCNEYNDERHSFNTILLQQWNFSNCPKKIIFEKYLKNSNFKNIIEKDSSFNIICDSINKQIIISPYEPYIDKINYDIKLIIDDDIEYEIKDIKSKLDTSFYSFSVGRKYYINYSIYSMTVNGNKSIQNNDVNIVISANDGTIKKK